MSPESGGAFDVLQGSGDQFVSWVLDFGFARSIEFLIHDQTLRGRLPSPDPIRSATAISWASCVTLGTSIELPLSTWVIE